ncbi:MAG TPA: 23S rRNA (guanosine(2251)-2'-O)-methyltransferase RlmB [Acidimicrobiales bacterium]|nr:23S rRNA (guanosine(2251)-2'-O)-methyltransferase RlmB [Acidimicrobiales bacterium]
MSPASRGGYRPPRRAPRDGSPLLASRGRPGEKPPGRGSPDRRTRPAGVGGEQVEGRRAVLELLRAGTRPVHELWVAEGLDPSPQLDEIERLAARRKVRTVVVPRRRLEAAARSESPQGVLARARALDEADLDTMAEGAPGRPALLLVLDGVADPHNLGSLLRTAECAGVTGLVLPRHRAVHVTPTVAKVAAGAIEHVPIAVVPGIPGALARLSQRGVTVIGLDAEAPMSLYELGAQADDPVALVLGSEGRGLARLSRKRCRLVVSIPRGGRLESLNVASAGAVACFELARHRHQRSRPPAGRAPGGRARAEPVVGVEPTT